MNAGEQTAFLDAKLTLGPAETADPVGAGRSQSFAVRDAVSER